MPFTYPYPRPAVTCDAVVFTMRSDDLALLLIRRREDPFKNHWALPGGFVNENESLERAAARELNEETGLANVKLQELGTFGDPGRDPRGHVITIAWVSFLQSEARITASDDATEAKWHSFRTLALEGGVGSRAGAKTGTKTGAKTRSRAPIKLAFDHAKIISRAYKRLCQHLDDPVRDRTFDLLPSRFTLADLQRFYEVVLGRSLPPRTFRKRLLDHALVVPATSRPTAKAATQLYRWNRR